MKKILVVEDTKTIREVISFMLKNRGYAVVEAADGGAVVELVKREHPDLILLDAVLPNRSGFELCTELKSRPELATIPVVMLTAITQGAGKTDEYWRKKSGANDFFSKPFRAQDLLVRIVALVGPAQEGTAGGSAQAPPPPPSASPPGE